MKPIVKNEGATASEKYLAKLAERSFLNLWCYPNVFIDKKLNGKGDGKELCDLLVVCGDHVLIFSDKTIAWPSGNDDQVNWKRWFKRAILSSANQVRGAQRWISEFPERIFLDAACTNPLPIALPPQDRMKVHGIVVALGAGTACATHFNGDRGSLMIVPQIKGDDHWKPDQTAPFCVGDIDTSGSFIHVLDDVTLDIVLRELDTITDFTDYLLKKEELIRSEKLIVAAGEEELVAYFMTHMNLDGEHDFTKQDGSKLTDVDFISIESGFYDSLLNNEQYIEKKRADKSSYVWDRLIETFTDHIIAGTTQVLDGQELPLSDHEENVRCMTVVRRHKRRALGEAIIGALKHSHRGTRFTRGMMPGPTESDQSVGYFFMTLDPRPFLKQGTYEEYRQIRQRMSETYALTFLQRYPKLEKVIGIATEPPNKKGSSEDLISAIRPEWTEEILIDLEHRKESFDIGRPENTKETSFSVDEFPKTRDMTERETKYIGSRKQRRAHKAMARRRHR